MKMTFAFLFFIFSASCAESILQIFISVGQILRVREWLFEKSGPSAVTLASQLARNGKFTAVFETGLISDCESFRTVVVVYSSISLLGFISKVRNFRSRAG